MLEILELTDRIISDCQKIQDIVRIELLKSKMEAAGDLSSYFWITLHQLNIDRNDPQVMATIEAVLLEKGLKDKRGKPSTKFQTVQQVREVIDAVLARLGQ